MADFRVIEGGGPEGRDRIFAEQEFKDALRHAVANMLRIIRGAGRPFDLIVQMSDVVATAIKVRDATGRLPDDILQTVLHGTDEAMAISEKAQKGEIDEATIKRWQDDGTIDRLYAERNIKDGALQIIASQLVGQTLQERAGEKEMSDGISKAIDARAKYRDYWNPRRAAPTKAARKKRKPTKRDADRLRQAVHHIRERNPDQS
jgi:hypothetical protein